MVVIVLVSIGLQNTVYRQTTAPRMQQVSIDLVFNKAEGTNFATSPAFYRLLVDSYCLETTGKRIYTT